jgi:cytochrome c oxidase subunit 2
MPVRIQSAVDAAGVQAVRIEWLWWLTFWVSVAVFVVVVGAVILAVRRGRSTDPWRPSERRLLIGVASATAVTVVILIGLLFANVLTGRAMISLEQRDPLVVSVAGHQWWWEVTYPHSTPSLQVTTANELHLPVGRPVRITFGSPDVIHSFWVPNLHGKMDLIPGRQTSLWLQADAPGVFRGQCAEFCGLQHAQMALTVTAESPEAFEAWLAMHRQLAPPPGTPEQRRGLQVIEQGSCAMCHTIRGTAAGARGGPDLTHVASRPFLAAGAVPNMREFLAEWIADPHHFKPGSHMPSTSLTPEDLQAVVAYLETLR